MKKCKCKRCSDPFDIPASKRKRPSYCPKCHELVYREQAAKDNAKAKVKRDQKRQTAECRRASEIINQRELREKAAEKRIRELHKNMNDIDPIGTRYGHMFA